MDDFGSSEMHMGSFFYGSSSKATPKSIVDSLPVRKITAEQLDQLKKQKDNEGLAKCMVCLVEYEVDESVRTMPCLHTFHKECIDKWLLERGSTCPICKFNIKKDYNVTSADQIQNKNQNQRGHRGQYMVHNRYNSFQDPHPAQTYYPGLSGNDDEDDDDDGDLYEGGSSIDSQ